MIKYRAQRGAALVTSLIVLVMLTLISVTAMNTTTLEEKLAINMQQQFSSFHAAESGFNTTFNNVDSINFGGTSSTQTSYPGGAEVLVTTQFRANAKPPNNSGYSASKFQAAHYDVISTGEVGRSQSTVRGGLYQILPGAYTN